MNCLYRKHLEFDLKIELYFQLRTAGLSVALEVGVPSDLHVSGWMSVDLAIFDGEIISAVIECKKPGQRMSYHSRQAQAYRAFAERFSIPAYFLNDGDDITSLVRLLLSCQ